MTKNNINKALEKETSSQVQIINKPLKLETVNEGSKEDNVLVRGTDNTVKYVSQSSLVSGGSQNLQQTLEAGDIAEFDSGNSRVKILKGDPNSRIIELTTSDGRIRSSMALGNTYASLSHSEPAPGRVNSNISATNEGIILSNNDNGTNGWYTMFKVPYNTKSQTTYNLPIDRPNGNYTLATVDQITGSSQNLQQTLDKGSTATLTNEANESETTFYMASTELDSRISISSESHKMGEEVGGEIIIANGQIQIAQQNTATNGLTSVEFEPPIGIGNQGAVLKFPAKEAGNYILATIDDIFLRISAPNVYERNLNSGEDGNASVYASFYADEASNTSYYELSTIKGDAFVDQKSFSLTSYNGIGDINWSANNSSGKIEFAEPLIGTGVTTYRIPPAKVGDYNKTYTLATTDDIKGGSPNLQQVLNQSPQTATVTSSEGRNEISFGHDFSSYRYDLDSRITNYIANENNYVKMGGQGTVGNSSSHLKFMDGEFELVKVAPTTGYGTNISIETPIAPTNLKFPAKPAGTYTLATLEDVSIPSLQQVYDKGRTISTDTGLIIQKTSSPNQGHTAIDGEVIEIYDNISQGINISKNKILGYGINRNNIIDFSKTTISQSTYKFPEKTDGTYVFATTSDLAIYDPAIWSKSKTELNTEYPNAINGFRVHCPYISTGATIYEKTSIGWVEYPIRLVYDPE